MTDPLPRNLFGRILIRVLAFEWLAGQVLLLTIAAIALAAFGQWMVAAFAGVCALAGGACIIWDELNTRDDQPRWP